MNGHVLVYPTPSPAPRPQRLQRLETVTETVRRVSDPAMTADAASPPEVTGQTSGINSADRSQGGQFRLSTVQKTVDPATADLLVTLQGQLDAHPPTQIMTPLTTARQVTMIYHRVTMSWTPQY